jgi:hypothetical protein
MICDTASILGDILSPVFTSPKVTWCRGVVRGTYEINYYDTASGI